MSENENEIINEEETEELPLEAKKKAVNVEDLVYVRQYIDEKIKSAMDGYTYAKEVIDDKFYTKEYIDENNFANAEYVDKTYYKKTDTVENAIAAEKARNSIVCGYNPNDIDGISVTVSNEEVGETTWIEFVPIDCMTIDGAVYMLYISNKQETANFIPPMLFLAKNLDTGNIELKNIEYYQTLDDGEQFLSKQVITIDEDGVISYQFGIESKSADDFTAFNPTLSDKWQIVSVQHETNDVVINEDDTFAVKYEESFKGFEEDVNSVLKESGCVIPKKRLLFKNVLGSKLKNRVDLVESIAGKKLEIVYGNKNGLYKPVTIMPSEKVIDIKYEGGPDTLCLWDDFIDKYFGVINEADGYLSGAEYETKAGFEIYSRNITVTGKKLFLTDRRIENYPLYIYEIWEIID